MLNTNKYKLGPVTFQELKASDLFLDLLTLSIAADR